MRPGKTPDLVRGVKYRRLFSMDNMSQRLSVAYRGIFSL